MEGELRRDEYMAQIVVAWEIARRFGERWTYANANGNPAIAREVLKAFEARTPEDVVWERRTRMWRPRRPYDDPGRMQP
jgi:hypothetical protein